MLAAPYPWPSMNSSTAPALLVPGLAFYAGFAIVLVTTSIALDLCRVHRRIARFRAPTRSAWFAAFHGTGLSTLADRLLDLAPDGEELIVQSAFDAKVVRGELLHHHRDWLTRTHAFTAFTLLLLIAVLGLAHRYGDIPLTGLAVPIAETLTIIGVLVILGWFSLLTVATLSESLLNTVARLPLKRLDILLLFQAGPSPIERGETHSASTCSLAQSDALQRLGATLEQTSNALRETVNRLWMTTQAVAEIQTSSERPIDISAIEQLSLAIQELSAAVGRGQTASPSSPSTPGFTPQPNLLSKRIRELLTDLD
jgi:hypothetical protein